MLSDAEPKAPVGVFFHSCSSFEYRMSITLRTAVVAGIAATLLYSQLNAVGIAYLEQATAEQCITHSWPVDAHQIHMDWCADNGYATK